MNKSMKYLCRHCHQVCKVWLHPRCSTSNLPADRIQCWVGASRFSYRGRKWNNSLLHPERRSPLKIERVPRLRSAPASRRRHGVPAHQQNSSRSGSEGPRVGRSHLHGLDWRFTILGFSSTNLWPITVSEGGLIPKIPTQIPYKNCIFFSGNHLHHGL